MVSNTPTIPITEAPSVSNLIRFANSFIFPPFIYDIEDNIILKVIVNLNFIQDTGFMKSEGAGCRP